MMLTCRRAAEHGRLPACAVIREANRHVGMGLQAGGCPFRKPQQLLARGVLRLSRLAISVQRASRRHALPLCTLGLGVGIVQIAVDGDTRSERRNGGHLKTRLRLRLRREGVCITQRHSVRTLANGRRALTRHHNSHTCCPWLYLRTTMMYARGRLTAPPTVKNK